MTWWRTPSVHLDGRLMNGNYDSTGSVVIGYTLFALGLAVALGAIWRRAVAALVLGFVGYFAARIFVDLSLRDHLIAPLRATYTGAQEPGFLHNAQIVSLTGTVNGHQILNDGGGFMGSAKLAAPDATNAVFHVVYQPDSHFWPLQLAETGLFAGAAVVLIGIAAWWTLRRAS